MPSPYPITPKVMVESKDSINLLVYSLLDYIEEQSEAIHEVPVSMGVELVL